MQECMADLTNKNHDKWNKNNIGSTDRAMFKGIEMTSFRWLYFTSFGYTGGGTRWFGQTKGALG